MSVIEKTTEIPTGTYVIDPTHSSASFAIRHAAARFRGGFDKIEGRLESADDEASLTGSVKVESIDIDDENIRPHLLSPEFFDAERAPEVTFASTAVETEGDELVVRGELDIAGQTHEVEARGHFTGPVPVPGGGEKVGLELSTEIDRTDYGFDWNMELPDGGTVLGNKVELVVNLELDQVES